VDAGNIFIYVLSASFFGVIAYLSWLSRRSHGQNVTQNVTQEEGKPRKAA